MPVLSLVARRAVSSAAAGSKVMVLNCGSSSLKFQVVGPQGAVLAGQADRLNTAEGRLVWRRAGVKQSVALPRPDYLSVVDRVCDLLEEEDWDLVGHRVVHGGELFPAAAAVTPSMLAALAPLDTLAPLHNPRQRAVMQRTLDRYPAVPQAAAFDTMWHSAMPERAFLYGLPLSWHQEHQIRRYGFHGLSHSYVAAEAARRTGGGPGLRTVSCHLGAGCSVAASRDGRCLDTSMGFSPGEGLVMGQRAGDIDPAIVPYMAARLGVAEGEVLRRCGEESGFLGLAGTPDSLELEVRAEAGDPAAARAIDLFCYRAAKWVAACIVPLGGLDAIVFTGGIGEKSSIKRGRILDLLAPLGVAYCQEANRQHGAGTGGRLGAGGRVQAWVLPTDEEAVIARHTRELFGRD